MLYNMGIMLYNMVTMLYNIVDPGALGRCEGYLCFGGPIGSAAPTNQDG